MNIVLLLDALGDQLAVSHAEFSGLPWFCAHQLTLLVLVHPHLVWCVHDTIASQDLAWSPITIAIIIIIIQTTEAKKSNSLAVTRLWIMFISYTHTFLNITYPGSLPCTQCLWVYRMEASSTHRVVESWNWSALLPIRDKTRIHY